MITCVVSFESSQRADDERLQNMWGQVYSVGEKSTVSDSVEALVLWLLVFGLEKRPALGRCSGVFFEGN